MDFESLVAQANSSVEKQNIPEAINLFEQALKVNSTSYDVLSKLGTLNLQIGNTMGTTGLQPYFYVKPGPSTGLYGG